MTTGRPYDSDSFVVRRTLSDESLERLRFEPSSTLAGNSRKSGALMWWDHLFDWIQDATVWEWIRTVLAALFGTLVGGYFTLHGQTKSALAQAQRDEIARQNHLADARRIDAQDDARALFRAFVDLDRDIRNAPAGDFSNGKVTWRPVWETIWTRERSTEIRVLAELIPEVAAREQVGKVVRYLGLAADYSREGDWVADSRWPVRHIASGLVGEGIATMSAYLRHDTHVFERDILWASLEASDEKMHEFLNDTDDD